MTVKLHLGDCLEVLATIPENSVDTCITDPPYELGFMGKKWDSSGIAFQLETWQAVFRVLKPGALLLAFGGTRTYHRMVCAIEDAGFEIRDTIAWVYGSGFPKSYNIGKAMESKALTGSANKTAFKNLDGEVSKVALGYNKNNAEGDFRPNDYNGRETTVNHKLHTEIGQLWDGWGTALKPSHEPIVVAMKPIDGTFVNNALTYGVAGLWIDGGRVGSETLPECQHGKRDGCVTSGTGKGNGTNSGGFNLGTSGTTPERVGRFPANFIHDGSDEVVGLFPSGGAHGGQGEFEQHAWMRGNITQNIQPSEGSAARFFYCAKASRSERNAGLEGMEEKVGGGMKGTEDQTLLTGSGNIRNNKMQNHHPTIKPIELMRYLVRLTKTPTGGVVLDPFTGSGTTGIACELEGREFIGIEREAEYVEIAEKRIAHYRLPILDDKWIPEVQE